MKKIPHSDFMFENRCGDRKINHRYSFPESAFYHNGQGGCVLDVTKAPFFAKGDGITDDTKALCQAMTFVRDHLEVQKYQDEVYCTERNVCNWIIFLPVGTYLVSDTVSQQWPALAFNLFDGWLHINYFNVESPEHEKELAAETEGSVRFLHGDPALTAADDNNGSFARGQYQSEKIYAEANWSIRIFGEDRYRTVIKLKDNSPGFGVCSNKPVVNFALLERGSNVNLGNFIENMTIDTGCGNPGAAALRWNSSNWGGMRYLTLFSGDGCGSSGIYMNCNNATGYCHDIEIKGFDCGIELSAGRESMVTLEYADITASEYGIKLGNAGSGGGGDNLSCRRMNINAPLPILVRQAGQFVFMDSSVCGDEYGIKVEKDGFCLVRNIDFCDVSCQIKTEEAEVCNTPFVDEFISTAVHGQRPWLKLPVREVPLFAEPTAEEWATVEDFGAAGDGITDDTEAVERALNSGKKVIFFTKPLYLFNGSLKVPAHVREICGCFSSLVRHKAESYDAQGLFVIDSDSEEPIRIRRFVHAGGVLVEHLSARTVLCEDLFVHFNHCRSNVVKDGVAFPLGAESDSNIWRVYHSGTVNEQKRQVFINNCVMPIGDDADGSLAVKGADFYGRMINSEHVPGGLYSFDDSNAWIFGFKSENTDTVFAARNNANVEVLGGSLLLFEQKNGPVLLVEKANLSAAFYLWHMRIVPHILRKDDDGIMEGRELKALSSEDAAVFLST